MSDMDKVKTALIRVMDSCHEGRTGEWDCSTEEGYDKFTHMIINLEVMAEELDIDISTAKYNQEK